MIRPLVVGVHPGQHPDIVQRAAGFAHALQTTLLCVWVDTSRAPAGDTTAPSVPVDPDSGDDAADSRAAEQQLREELDRSLHGVETSWSLVSTVGDVAHGLDAQATAHDAAIIVVGARRPGIGGWMNEVVSGSVAGRLAHLQHRPVTVLPALPEPAASVDDAPDVQ